MKADLVGYLAEFGLEAYEAVMRAPAQVVSGVAVERAARRGELRANAFEDALLAGGVEWGTTTRGHVPPSRLPYTVVDDPARAHLRELREAVELTRGTVTAADLQRRRMQEFRRTLRGG